MPILLLVVLWGLVTVSQVAGQQPAGGSLVLTNEQDRYSLAGYIELLEDPSGELTIDQIASPEFAGRFFPGPGENPNLGFTRSAVWVRLRLENQSPNNAEWLMVLTDSRMQYVDLYLSKPDGTGFTTWQTGTLRPFSSRAFPNSLFVFPIPIPNGSEQTVYLRFQSQLAMTFPMVIQSWASFIKTQQVEMIKVGLFYGAMIILVGYNFFLLLTLQEASYLYYVLFLVLAMITRATNEGIAEQYLWPHNLPMIGNVVLVSFALVNLCALKFTEVFLIRLVRIRWLSWLFTAMMIGWGVIIASLIFRNATGAATNWMVILTSVVLVVGGIVVLQQGHREARFFLLAWPGFFIPLSLVRLVRLGVLPSSLLWPDVHFMLLWLALFWSLALADRIKLLKDETESANQALTRSERRLNQFLEAMPVGVSVYGPNRVVQYFNQRTGQILGNPKQGIHPNIGSGRTVEQAAGYYSLQTADSNQPYPANRLPLSQALQGEPGHADDIVANLVDRKVPLEVWANPIFNEAGEVQYAVAVFQDITHRRQVEADLEAYRQNLEQLVEARTEELTLANQQLQSEITQRLDQTRLLAAAQERNRLARDLHDSVIQTLFSANLIAEVLPRRWQRDPQLGLESLQELHHLTRGALAEMRTLLLELRPESLPKIPLGELIAQLTEAVTSRGYLPFELYLDNVPPLPNEVHTTFYRIAQEALNNAVKHSHAKRVSVSLNAVPVDQSSNGDGWSGLVRLTIRDDGIGFQTGVQDMKKMGLRIMSERATTIGADLCIESRPGAGTKVILTWEDE